MRIFFVILVFVASAIGVFAQKVKLITDEERLSNSLVNHVYQDSRGYIWISTEDGLNSFDGMTVTSYQAGDAENAMSSSYIQRVFEDSSGRLWIGMMNGICIFNRETGDFRRVECEEYGEIVKPHVADIVEDKSGDVWFVTSGRGILKYDATVQKAVRDMSVLGQNSDIYLSAALVDKLGYQEIRECNSLRKRLYCSIRPQVSNGLGPFCLRGVAHYNMQGRSLRRTKEIRGQVFYLFVPTKRQKQEKARR